MSDRLVTAPADTEAPSITKVDVGLPSSKKLKVGLLEEPALLVSAFQVKRFGVLGMSLRP